MATKLKQTRAATDRKAQRISRHHAALSALANYCGVKEPNVVDIANRLWALEAYANNHATYYCNGYAESASRKYTADHWDAARDYIGAEVCKLFAGKVPPGFKIEGDPRGYILKIDDAQMDILRMQGIHLETDMGGYGLLGPDMEVG